MVCTQTQRADHNGLALSNGTATGGKRWTDYEFTYLIQGLALFSHVYV
jgi:hypothetical protein